MNQSSSFWQVAVSRRFRYDLPVELLSAYELSLMTGSKDDLLEAFRIWKTGTEAKGLNVNINKTKILQCMGVLRRLMTLGLPQ